MIKHIDNHIKLLRLKAGFTNDDDVQKIAKMCEISVKTLYAIEEGARKPSIQTAYKLAKIYSCTLEDIIKPYFEG